jgi:hypothetical protein
MLCWPHNCGLGDLTCGLQTPPCASVSHHPLLLSPRVVTIQVAEPGAECKWTDGAAHCHDG